MPNNPWLSDAAAIAAANAVCALANGGSLRVYSGTQPTNANTAITSQTLLATIALPNPAFQPAGAGGVAAANAIASVAAGATGTATWFRVLKSDNTTVVFDGSVGTSGCDLNLNSVAIASGATITISSFSYTQTE